MLRLVGSLLIQPSHPHTTSFDATPPFPPLPLFLPSLSPDSVSARKNTAESELRAAKQQLEGLFGQLADEQGKTAQMQAEVTMLQKVGDVTALLSERSVLTQT